MYLHFSGRLRIDLQSGSRNGIGNRRGAFGGRIQEGQHIGQEPRGRQRLVGGDGGSFRLLFFSSLLLVVSLLMMESHRLNDVFIGRKSTANWP